MGPRSVLVFDASKRLHGSMIPVLSWMETVSPLCTKRLERGAPVALVTPIQLARLLPTLIHCGQHNVACATLASPTPDGTSGGIWEHRDRFTGSNHIRVVHISGAIDTGPFAREPNCDEMGLLTNHFLVVYR